MSISVVINTRNEEKNIERAIKSVKAWADEIVVVDMESEDETVKTAKKLGAKVFSHRKMNYVEPARNFALGKATGEWVFILDADEEATKELLTKLTSVIAEGSADFVRIPRKNIIFSKWMKHSRWWPDLNIRFFRKGTVTWEDDIHSIPVTSGNGINLEEKEEFAIVHHNYQSVTQYIDRLNRYSSIQANELKKKNVKISYSDFVKRPTAEFLSRFFAGEGYEDGLHGLAVALLQAFSELVVYIKLWELEGFEEKKVSLKELTNDLTLAQKDVNYWKAHALIQKGAGVTQKIKRKFKLS